MRTVTQRGKVSGVFRLPGVGRLICTAAALRLLLGACEAMAESVSGTNRAGNARVAASTQAVQPAPWAKELAACATPRDICRLVARRVSYRADREDHWASPEETWARRRGDCEDFAILIEELCHAKGFDARVQVYFPCGGRSEGHAVVVGRWADTLWMSSNGSYRRVESEDEIRDRVVWELGLNAGQMWHAVLSHADMRRRLASAGSENRPRTGAGS